MLRKARNLNIPDDLISELFYSLVTPVLLYGSEIYAPYPYKDIEKVHLKFCKYLLSLQAEQQIIWYVVNSKDAIRN